MSEGPQWAGANHVEPPAHGEKKITWRAQSAALDIQRPAPLGFAPSMAMHLDQIIPWGRTRAEYELMFELHPEELRQRTLDCGGGPASFTAEMANAGFSATAVDPLYSFSGEEIKARFEATIETVLSQVRETPNDWTWTFHRNLDELRANRIAAMERFQADYSGGKAAGRYVVGELPGLPFADKSFDRALCSHLLFLYSDSLSEEFHIRSVLELCRVAREVRIFPLLNLNRQLSRYLAPVRSVVARAGWASEIIKVRYELQRDGNEMLRLFRS
jgi:SAM-dependent methyltransferase